MSNVDRRPELARTGGRNFAEIIEREVTSWEGVTKRRGKFGTVEFRLGRYVLGKLPQDGLDRGAGVTA